MRTLMKSTVALSMFAFVSWSSLALAVTAIDIIPFTITKPGVYVFTKRWPTPPTVTGNAITVMANDVVIDMKGYALVGATGGSSSNNGIYIDNKSNTEIRNGIIKNFGGSGITTGESSPDSSNIRITGVRLLDNAVYGVRLGGKNHLIKDCFLSGNGNVGIYVEGFGTSVTGNEVNNNIGGGISLDYGGGIITGNVANNNGDFGIHAGQASAIINNCTYNNAGIGISAWHEVLISDNVSNNNGASGIQTTDSCKITNNHVNNNNTSGDIYSGGIRASTGSVVKGNALSNNYVAGIYTATMSGKVLIEDNFIYFSPVGIKFYTSGVNYYSGNRLTGNTANYADQTDDIDGGGNVAF